MSDIEHSPVWVIYTGNHLTDVIAERENGDTLPNERAVEYVPASQLAGVVETYEPIRKYADLLAGSEDVTIRRIGTDLLALLPTTARRQDPEKGLRFHDAMYPEGIWIVVRADDGDYIYTLNEDTNRIWHYFTRDDWNTAWAEGRFKRVMLNDRAGVVGP